MRITRVSALALGSLAAVLAGGGCGTPSPEALLAGSPSTTPDGGSSPSLVDAAPAAGTQSCAQIVDCAGRCADSDQACFARCQANGTADGLRILRELLRCAEQAGCQENGCTQRLCGPQWQACFGGGSAPDAGTPVPVGQPIGDPCAATSDCSGGLCLSAADIPDGYCSKRCGGQIVSMGDSCPAGAACTQVSEAASVCLDLCGGANGACRSGYACAQTAGGSVCVPRCRSASDCAEGNGCNPTSGLCEAGLRQPGRVGAACASAGECASNACLTQEASMNEWPGGYCLQGCTAELDGMPCPGQDGICVSIPQNDGTTSHLCLGACTTGVDCRREYMCSADAGIATAQGFGICLPRCGNYQCDVGFTCDTSVGVCTQGMPGSGSAPQVERQDLGTVSIDAPTYAKTVSIQVPEGAVSFTLVAAPSDPAVSLIVTKVTAPNGQVLQDLEDPLASSFKVATVGAGAIAVLYPNAPRLTLVPGKYELQLVSVMFTGGGVVGARSDTKLDVLTKRQSGVIQGGSLPVTIWFTQQRYLDAQTAPTNAVFQQALAVLTEVYAKVGITIGPFSYVDITGLPGQSLAVIDNEGELQQLFAQANSSNARGLNFFMVDQIMASQAGFVTLGQSGGIPGPPSFPGLAHGGVAVSLSVLAELGAGLGEVMAHEGGHYLGLWHTSERDGLAYDPLLDTPECQAGADRNGDKIVDEGECGGKGSDNLMFWLKGNVPHRTVTNDQRFVLLRNPALQ